MKKLFLLLLSFALAALLFLSVSRFQTPKVAAPNSPNAIELRLAIDISGSIGARLEEVKRGSLEVADALKIGDRAVLVVFSDMPQILWSREFKSKADLDAFKAAIGNIQHSTRRGTDQVEGYQKLLTPFAGDAKPFARRYVAVCSDSYADMPDGQRREWGRVNFGALARDVSLRLFYYNNERDTDFLRLLTRQGVRYRVASQDESSAALHDLQAEINFVHSDQWRESNPQKGKQPAPVSTSVAKRSATPILPILLLGAALGVAVLLLAFVRARLVRQQNARAKWRVEQAREAEAKLAVVPTRDVLRLLVPEGNRFFERDIVPSSAFTFGTREGADFAFRAPNAIIVEGTIEVDAKGNIALTNNASTFPWQIGKRALRPGERMIVESSLEVQLAPQLTLRLKREIVAGAKAGATVDALLRAAREQRRALVPDAQVEEVGL